MHLFQTDRSLERSSRGVIRRVAVPSVIVMFFLICAGSPPALRADPISFQITWTLTSGGPAPAPATTSYTYDPITSLFTGFVVNWDNTEFDFAALLNSRPEASRIQFQDYLTTFLPLVWNAEVRIFDPHSFRIGSPPGVTYTVVAGFNGLDKFASGTFTVAQTSVPEPATLTLCGIGLGGLLLTRFARNNRRKRPHV